MAGATEEVPASSAGSVPQSWPSASVEWAVRPACVAKAKALFWGGKPFDSCEVAFESSADTDLPRNLTERGFLARRILKQDSVAVRGEGSQ